MNVRLTFEKEGCIKLERQLMSGQWIMLTFNTINSLLHYLNCTGEMIRVTDVVSGED